MVLQSARTLADLTEQRVIPADYLYTLILLFLCLVLDRVCYTLGHHGGKVPALADHRLPASALPQRFTDKGHRCLALAVGSAQLRRCAGCQVAQERNAVFTSPRPTC